MNFSKKEIHYALLGNLLGDAYLRKNINTQHWVESVHTNKQREYVSWLKDLYESWGLRTVSRFDFKRKTNYGEFTYSQVSCKLQTNKHVEHNRLYNKTGVKYFSKYVAKRINVLGLLLWWLDDGSLTIHKKINGSVSRHGSLATHNFDYNSQLRIQKMFKERFDINVKIYKAEKETFYIYFNATNFRKFFDLLRPYLHMIPTSMMYKFNMQYVENRLKNSKSFLKYNLPEQYNLLNNRK